MLHLLRDTYNEIENLFNASIATFSDAKKTPQNIHVSNISKLIFGNLNINSLRSKFDLLCKQVKGSTDIFMISEA